MRITVSVPKRYCLKTNRYVGLSKNVKVVSIVYQCLILPNQTMPAWLNTLTWSIPPRESLLPPLPKANNRPRLESALKIVSQETVCSSRYWFYCRYVYTFCEWRRVCMSVCMNGVHFERVPVCICVFLCFFSLLEKDVDFLCFRSTALGTFVNDVKL